MKRFCFLQLIPMNGIMAAFKQTQNITHINPKTPLLFCSYDGLKYSCNVFLQEF